MLTPTGVTVNEYNTAIKNDTLCHIRLTFTEQGVVFTDADFEQGGVTITTYLNGEQDLTMGRAVKSMLTAYMFINDKTRSLLWENECQLEIGADVNGSTVWTTLGYFTGEKPEKLNREDIVVFTAYDRMSKFETLADNWFASLTYPMTVQQLYASLCSYVGVQYVSGDELSNIMSRSYATAPITSNGLLCRDVLALIAEAAGCYAKIDTNGKVKLVWFEDHTDYVVTGDDEFRVDSLGINFGTNSKTWEDLESYTWEQLEQMTWSDIEYYQQQLQIKCLSVKQTIDDVGVLLPTGGSGNTYMIVDNPFLTTANDTEVATYIQPILDRLVAFGGYLPMSVTCVGNPLVEAGDIITAYVKGEEVAMPIFVKEMTCTSACTDRYEATGNVKRQEITPVNREKLSQGGRFHIFRNDIDELYSELYDPTTGDVSMLNQTASALGLSAAGIDIVGSKYVRIESGGTLDVIGQNFKIDSTNALIDIGDWEFNDGNIHFISNSTDNFYIKPCSHSYGDIFDGSSVDVLALYNPAFGSHRFMTWKGGYNLQYLYGLDIDAWLESTEANCYPYISFYKVDKTTGNPYDVPGEIKNVNKISGYSSNSLKLIASTIDLNGYTETITADPDNKTITGVRTMTFGQYVQTSPQYNDYAGYVEVKAYNGHHIKLNMDGYIDCNDVRRASSREKKHDIEKINCSGKIIDNLNPVSFVYNGDATNRKRYGLIYEEAVDVMPDICMDVNGEKSITYNDLISVLLKETQELRKRVAELEKRVNDLERR